MADCMNFPDTVEEFMEQYKVVDTEQVYTNGTEFVLIYRMKQWFEHLQSAQPDVPDTNVGDMISRQAAKQELYKMLHDCFWADDEEQDAVAVTLDNLPSIQPEIIQCKDCIRYHEPSCLMAYDGKEWSEDHGFCHAGERRTDGSD